MFSINAPNFGNKPPQTLEGKVESLEKEVGSLKEMNFKLINDLNSIMGWCSQLFATHQQQKQQIEYLTQVVSYLHQQSLKNTPNTPSLAVPEITQQPHTETSSTTAFQQPSSFQKQPATVPPSQPSTEYTPKQRGGEDRERGYRQKERFQDNRERNENRDRNTERNSDRPADTKPQQDRNRKPPPPRGNPPVLTNLATGNDQPCRGWFSASELTSETNTALPPNSAVIIGPAPAPSPSPAPVNNPQPAPAPVNNPQPAPTPMAASPSPSPSQPQGFLKSQVTQVLDLFPDAPVPVVEKDLRQTKSVDATVARILDGSLTWQGKQF